MSSSIGAALTFSVLLAVLFLIRYIFYKRKSREEAHPVVWRLFWITNTFFISFLMLLLLAEASYEIYSDLYYSNIRLIFSGIIAILFLASLLSLIYEISYYLYNRKQRP